MSVNARKRERGGCLEGGDADREEWESWSDDSSAARIKDWAVSIASCQNLAFRDKFLNQIRCQSIVLLPFAKGVLTAAETRSWKVVRR
jgi:hypothetical protein